MENLDKSSLSKPLEEVETMGKLSEITEKINNIVSLEEIDFCFWEMAKLKIELRKNHDLINLITEKIIKVYEKVKLIKDTNQRFKYIYKIVSYYDFVQYFNYLKENEPKTIVEENENTKREILMIWQMHYRDDFWNDLETFEMIQKSQKLIEIFVEYFLEEWLKIWNEWLSTDIEWVEKFVRMKHSWDAAYFSNLILFLKANWKIEIDFCDSKHTFNITNKEDKQKIDKFSEMLSEIEFIWKSYKKENDYKTFYRILSLKYLINKYFKNQRDLLYTFGAERMLKNKGRRKFINMESSAIVKKEQLKYISNIKDLENKNVAYTFNEEIIEILKLIDKNLINYDDEIHNKFIKDIASWGSNLYNYLKEFLDNYNGEKNEIYYSILEKFKKLMFTAFWKREKAVIENIEKRIPDTQKKVPIIFWAWHLNNWEHWINKHNKENPNNNYSLKTIDLSGIKS